MIQKKLNSSNKVRSSLLLYIICIISVLTINLVNMGRGSEIIEIEDLQQQYDRKFRAAYSTIQVIAEKFKNSLGAKVIKGIADFTTDKALKQELYDIDISIQQAVTQLSRKKPNEISSADKSISTESLSSFIVNMIRGLPEKYIDKPTEKQALSGQTYDLGFIRGWFDNIYKVNLDYTTYTTGIDRLYQLLSQIIYHSKTMLVLTVHPLVINLYLGSSSGNNTNIISMHYEKSRSINSLGDNTYEMFNRHYIDFKSDSKEYTMFFEPKDNGVAFGNYIVVGEKQRENTIKLINTKRFFLKTYYGYPAKNNHGSDSALNDTLHNQTSVSKGNDGDIIKFKSLGLEEPFVYKVLEKLNFGPKAHFVINPYIRNGFYILTEDLSDKKNNFVLARNWEFNQDGMFTNILTNKEMIVSGNKNSTMSNIKIDIEQIDRKKIEVEEKTRAKKDNLLVINLREMQIMSLILKLNDIKDDNIGFLIDRNKLSVRLSDKDKQFALEEQLTQNILDWKFVDFLIPNENNREMKRGDVESGLFVPPIDSGIAIEKLSNPKLIVKQEDKVYRDKMALNKFEKRLYTYKSTHEELFDSTKQVESEQILKRLLEQQSLYITNLMNTERGESEDEAVLRHPTEKVEGEERFRNRTNAELIGFKIGNVPVYNEHDFDSLSEREKNIKKEKLKIEQSLYINTAFNNLNTYVNNIVQNYKELKRIINDGYNRYFDENGNLKPVELQQQNQPQQQPQNQENQ